MTQALENKLRRVILFMYVLIESSPVFVEENGTQRAVRIWGWELSRSSLVDLICTVVFWQQQRIWPATRTLKYGLGVVSSEPILPLKNKLRVNLCV